MEETAGKKKLVTSLRNQSEVRFVAACESLEITKVGSQDDDRTMKGSTWENGVSMRLFHGITFVLLSSGCTML